jgi:hypothetical protein
MGPNKEVHERVSHGFVTAPETLCTVAVRVLFICDTHFPRGTSWTIFSLEGYLDIEEKP